MNYRLLGIEMGGRIREVLVVDVADDQAALVRAQSFGHHQAVEIWCGNQQVATFQPGSP